MVSDTEATDHDAAIVQFEDRIPDEKRVVADAGDLIAWLHTVVGDELRSVAAYDSGTLKYLYIREDVEDAYDSEEFEGIAEEYASVERIGDVRRRRQYRLGKPEYSVHGFAEGMLVRVPTGPERGLVVTLDADADVQFPAFVQELEAAEPEITFD